MPDATRELWTGSAVAPRAASLAAPRGLKHADVTLTNVLRRTAGSAGLIDFGDMHHTAAVCDLAIALTSVLRNTAPSQPVPLWQLPGRCCAGTSDTGCSAREVDVLGDLVLARLALTRAISAPRAAAHPENRAYISQYDEAGDRVTCVSCARRGPASSPGAAPARRHRARARRIRPRRPHRGPDLLAAAGAAMGGACPRCSTGDRSLSSAVRAPWLFTADGRA